jgi:hypothetical protein
MRCFITTHSAAKMSGVDIRRVRKLLAETPPASILLTPAGIVAVFDIGVVENLIGRRLRPIQVQLEHAAGKN